jgi:Carbohydrate binding domain (family 11)
MSKLVSVSLLLVTAALAACVQHGAEGPQVFGGKGANVTSLDERPLPPGAGDPQALGPCGKNGPVSDAQVIDDFEDGNDRIFKGFQRDGFWFAASDKTEGSTITPTTPFAPELLPAAESNKDNRYAAHLTAAGESNWGVVWGTALHWTRDGLKCPLNVSAFAGVRFRAKGPGKIRVSVAVPEVTPKEGGGTCVDRCYDAHGKLFLLSEAWDSYEMRWEKMQQGGWGTEARFTPERIVNLAVNVDVKSLPIDLWLDDVELIPQTPPSAPAAH